MNILVFDVETIPDIDSGKKIFNLEGLSDKNAAELMFSHRYQKSNGRTEFLQHYLHKIVTISVVLKTDDKLSVWSLGDKNSTETELLERFFEGIERYTPVIVSWNGSGFDLPVIHYRSLIHGVVAQRYWENGDDDQSFRWNNYLSRFHSRHTDLMDVLSGYITTARAPLNEIATILGFPGKMGMSGEKVWDCYLDGDIESIRNYCETDALNTYLIYLKYQLMRGRLTNDLYITECQKVCDMLENENKIHLKEFLKVWQAC
jgi:predicted PolB exonuclease-like 3'-5' exonuclease|tara:strand:- start:25 stop:804 length:780 start_codon:yes stop_codon:yes gene_type:complete